MLSTNAFSAFSLFRDHCINLNHLCRVLRSFDRRSRLILPSFHNAAAFDTKTSGTRPKRRVKIVKVSQLSLRSLRWRNEVTLIGACKYALGTSFTAGNTSRINCYLFIPVAIANFPILAILLILLDNIVAPERYWRTRKIIWDYSDQKVEYVRMENIRQIPTNVILDKVPIRRLRLEVVIHHLTYFSNDYLARKSSIETALPAIRCPPLAYA